MDPQSGIDGAFEVVEDPQKLTELFSPGISGENVTGVESFVVPHRRGRAEGLVVQSFETIRKKSSTTHPVLMLVDADTSSNLAHRDAWGATDHLCPARCTWVAV